MASAVRLSVDSAQTDLDSLIHITQHLSDLLDIPEPQPRLLWPPKLGAAFLPQSTPLPAIKLTMPRFCNVNGSKLHTYSKKAAPYPLAYNQAVLDSDICDRITLKKLCKNGLTLHEFSDGPPRSVLDIGTGSGNWVLEAASQWQQTTRFVGLDLVEIQPTLSMNDPLTASHNRIQWVQGNALDELPFEQEFDFVRICKISLGVPENKWHHLLEEAVRVLKPGGILEIIEEDVIFPYRPLPDDGNHNFDTMSRSTAPSVSTHGDFESSGSSGDHSIRTFPAASTRRPLSVVVSKTLNPRTRSRSLGASSNNVPTNIPNVKPNYSHSIASTFSSYSSEWISILPTLTPSEAEALGISLRDPRDHSILHHAWNAMLDQRFITSKPTSLLAFYLTIHLESVRSHEPLQIIAPLPSYLSQTRQPSPPPLAEEDLYEVHLGTIDAAPSSKSKGSGVFTTRDASMHLRRVLQVVLGCSEALWPQVKARYPDMPRDCFDMLLRDFELDMLDRIDTRSALKSWFGWDSQMGTSDLRRWRERVAAVASLPHPEEPPLIKFIVHEMIAQSESFTATGLKEPASKGPNPALNLPQTKPMDFAKRLQSLLRRPKRDSETSETNSTMEIKEALEPAVPHVEAVNLPTVILSDVSGGNSNPVYQMEPQPIEEVTRPMFKIERPSSPPETAVDKEEGEDEDAPLPLAPKVMIDPNIPSILNPSADRRSPTTGQKKEGSPQTIRFELTEPPERPNSNYKRLSAVSSSQWRLLPFSSLGKGPNILPRPTSIIGATGVQDGGTFGMTQSVETANPFPGMWLGAGYPAGLLMEADVTKELHPFVEEGRPELLRDLSGEVRQIGLHAVFEGSYSNVFRGLWKGTLVAIKVIRGVGVSESMTTKVRDQRKEWWRLSHPNVLYLYGFCDDFGSYGASISPWLKNGNAATHIRRNPVKPSERFRLWCDVVEGLVYLHSREPPVVHGDLKPANVMMNDEGAAVLCDFGLAHIISDEVASGMTTTTNQTGTVRYLACELVNSDDMPDPTPASDIYALGCLGLEFLFLRTPFANRRNPAQIFKDIAMCVPPAPHIPFAGKPPPPVEHYWKILTQCWNSEPQERPNVREVQDYVGESKDDLVAVLKEDFVPAPGLILDDMPISDSSNAPIYRSSEDAASTLGILTDINAKPFVADNCPKY